MWRTVSNNNPGKGVSIRDTLTYHEKEIALAKNKATMSRTPRDISLAVAEAEPELVRPPHGKNQKMQLPPNQIETRPELFQPRGFSNSFLDTEHVDKLVKHIATKGELEPPLVVKLGKKWVCVDGHHRIAAYIKQNKKRIHHRR